VHLADSLALPDGYAARPWRGAADLPGMLTSLREYRALHRDEEFPTLEQMENSYAHLTDCDPDIDIAVLIDGHGEQIGYARASHDDIGTGERDCIVFAPVRPPHITHELFVALVRGMEQHMEPRARAARRARYRAYSIHPGPDQPAVGEAAWLEELGYVATEWGASLLRPHLDDVPDVPLPEGVELRRVQPHEVRRVWEAHFEAFRGEWDFKEATDDDIDEMVDDPLMHDTSLWQVAWVGDQVVGQVKPFVNDEENASRGYRRGYTEYISTHHDWRGRGIARALLARALVAVRERGMTEAMLGVDTNNPGGAFQLYTSLGFQLQKYDAVYTRPYGDPAAA
jgi:mycothiol synthase